MGGGVSDPMRKYVFAPAAAGVVGGVAGSMFLDLPSSLNVGSTVVPAGVGYGVAVAVGSAVGHAGNGLIDSSGAVAAFPAGAQATAKLVLPAALAGGAAVVAMRAFGNDYVVNTKGMAGLGLTAAASHMVGDKTTDAMFGQVLI